MTVETQITATLLAMQSRPLNLGQAKHDAALRNTSSNQDGIVDDFSSMLAGFWSLDLPHAEAHRHRHAPQYAQPRLAR